MLVSCHGARLLPGPDGTFALPDVPPGDYTIAIWHEKLGEQDQKVTVAPKDSKTVDQSFKAGMGE